MANNCRVEVDLAGRMLLGAVAMVWLPGCTPLAEADALGADPGLGEPTPMADLEVAPEPPTSRAEPAVVAPNVPKAPAEQPAAAGDIPLDTGPAKLAPAPDANEPVAGEVPADAGASELETCPGGQRFGTRCYRVALVPLPWNAARADCLATGAELAVIEDAQEDDVVGRLVDESLWLGASNQARENLFEWVDGSAVGFGNWGPGQPDAFPGPDCVQKRQEAGEPWYDQPCGSSFLYVCESEVAP